VSLILRSLKENEAIVRKGFNGLMECGQALREIRDNEQYRESGHESWEDYLADRWKIKARQAERYIDAAVVTKNIEAAVVKSGKKLPAPKRESVARAVKKATKNPEKQAEVWEEATKETDEPTARDVEKAAEKVLKPPPKEPKPSASNGKTTLAGFDRDPIVKQFGVLARAIDDAATRFGVNNSHEHKLATRSLGAALEAFQSFAGNIDAVIKHRSKS
jgi:hypothetical protein